MLEWTGTETTGEMIEWSDDVGTFRLPGGPPSWTAWCYCAWPKNVALKAW